VATTTRDNGRVRTSRPRPRPTRPGGFWPLPPDQPLVVCSTCAGPVPATDRAQALHRQWHEHLAGLEDGRPR
jgi:hypothetical protein